ncbi:hypothetical protein GCM10010964_03210 [Caldovatus sediminis]|uniref:Uncharacterized protein n=1 Tax=Caldovatus sediminis TaxID=2041189 RepID=A0A8J3E9V9_9PROT|nr:hypothetical protein [Caldovatus sediminis]GGG18338.1 hypothetical protein GCM10010964_03210 [Caldovatus sediminis]
MAPPLAGRTLVAALAAAPGGAGGARDSAAPFDEGLRGPADGGATLARGRAAGAIPRRGAEPGRSPGEGRHAQAPRVPALRCRPPGRRRQGAPRPAVHPRFPFDQFRAAMAGLRRCRASGHAVLPPLVA